jgi:hypothetical protein
MSLKIHFLHSHLEFFPPKLSAVNGEYEESFRQDISTMEKRYAGQSSQNILADYSWNLTEEVSVCCQLQMNESLKEVLNLSKMKHLFSYFYYLIA